MAEQQDDAQKTEDPTQKRLDDALEKGDVQKSQELKHWCMLTAVTIAVVTTGPLVVRGLGDSLSFFVEYSGTLPTDGGAITALLGTTFSDIAIILAIPALILMMGALAGNVVQHKLVFTFEKIKPKFSKISPLAGFKRLFSMNSVVEFTKSILKIGIVTAVTVWVVWPEWARLEQLMTVQTEDLLPLVFSIVVRMLLGVVAVMTAIAAFDIMYQRMQHTKKMRMTKQEVKDEHKQMEGDPMVKARLRQIRMERARQRMMAAVPEADVVITNPTHFAVALTYDQVAMAAPKLVAKGADHVAAKIREIAEENDVPLVENPPLARTLFATVEIDQEVPIEHYRAVAEVISYVMRLRKSHGGKRAR